MIVKGYVRLFTTVIAVCLASAGCRGPADLVIRPEPTAVSQPVPVNEVQDAAIWLHPTEPAKGILLITNEKRGLEVHDMDGLLRKHVDDGIKPCYVDVLYEFPLDGSTVDLVLASCMSDAFAGVRVWRVDPVSRKLHDVTAGPAIRVFDGRAPVGLCTYHSRKTGKCYFFVTLREGKVEQHELSITQEGKVTARRVRSFALQSEVKSCIADDECGAFYVAEDEVGIWRYAAEPDEPTEGRCVIRVGENGLLPNAKGPELYCAAGGRGYILVVSQGTKGTHTCVKVYRRDGENEFVATIDPVGGRFGRLDHTSGLALTNQPTIPLFAEGVLAINDQINANASEDFKLYSWKDVARQGGLLIDTTWSPRPSRSGR